MKLSVKEVQGATGGKVRGLSPGSVFFGYVVDSREAFPGCLFIALPGSKVHGREFAGDALRRGAIGVLVDQEIGHDIPQILVRDTKKALFDLAKYGRKKLESVTIIAVTGSVGKTTTKDMIAHILSSCFRVYKSPRSFNSSIGVPLTLLNTPPEAEILVSEIGAQKPGELLPLAHLVSPEVAVITRIARAHLKFFFDLTRIAKEKRSLLEALRERGVGVVNKNSPLFSFLREAIPQGRRILTFGIGDGDIAGKRLEFDEMGSTFWVGEIRFRLQLPGRGFAEDALASIATSSLMGVNFVESAQRLETFRAPSGRMERIALGDLVILNDAYNSNPDSLKELLEAIPERNGRKTVFVLGDMLELGYDSPALHREAGYIFSQLGHKNLVTVGLLAEEIANGARRRGVKEVHSFSDTKEAAQFLNSYLEPGDLLVLKASRAVGLEDIIDELRKNRRD